MFETSRLSPYNVDPVSMTLYIIGEVQSVLTLDHNSSYDRLRDVKIIVNAGHLGRIYWLLSNITMCRTANYFLQNP
jgi:hypothetical protein